MGNNNKKVKALTAPFRDRAHVIPARQDPLPRSNRSLREAWAWTLLLTELQWTLLMNNPSGACPKPWQAIPADNPHNPELPDLEMGPGPPLEQGQICPWTLRMVLVAVGYVVPPA